MLEARSVRRAITPARVIAVRDGVSERRSDRLAGEEPMEIRAGGPGQDPVSVAVTMRTPGHDFELATGFLFTEGLIGSREAVRVSYCDALEGEQRYNVVTVRLARRFDERSLKRNFYASSSCGVCGKASLEQLAVLCEPVPDGPRMKLSTLTSLPRGLRGAQRVFDATGGLHAAGLFDRTGDVVAVREDIGRHNAVDKLIGSQLMRDGSTLHASAMMISGRAGYEIVQKAAIARIPIVCAVSAPSSLAVETAAAQNITLVGFLRDSGCNIYSGADRIALAG
jgi:FdhD protein